MEESPFPQAGNDDHEALCRVCRGNASEGPLKRPCKCKGSLAHVHEACLENWLQISKGTKCELCKHPFKWENGERPVAVELWVDVVRLWTVSDG